MSYDCLFRLWGAFGGGGGVIVHSSRGPAHNNLCHGVLTGTRLQGCPYALCMRSQAFVGGLTTRYPQARHGPALRSVSVVTSK